MAMAAITGTIALSPSSSSGGGGGLLFDECTLHLEQLLLNTSQVPGPPGTGAKILGAWGLGAGDLGSYSLCESIAVQGKDGVHPLVHYCWMGKDITSAIGLCVPRSCTQHVLVRNARLIVSVVEHVSYNRTVDDWQAGCTATGDFGTTSVVSAVTILCLCAFVVASSVAAVRKRCAKLMERGCDCVGKSSLSRMGYYRQGEVDEIDVWSGWSPSNGGGGPLNASGGLRSLNRVPIVHRRRVKPNQDSDGEDSGSGEDRRRVRGISGNAGMYGRYDSVEDRFRAQTKKPNQQSDSDAEQSAGGAGESKIARRISRSGLSTTWGADTTTKTTIANRLNVPLLSPNTLLEQHQPNPSPDHNRHHPPPLLTLSPTSRQQLQQQQRQQQQQKYLTWGALILNSFSLPSAYRQLCSRDRRPLAPLHALRVLATLWIILGNVIVYMIPVVRNLAAVEESVTQDWTAQVPIGAVLANDCFLVLGGFFAGHSFLVRLKAVNRKSAFSSISNLRYGFIDIPRMYAQRLLRILPTYGLVLVCLVFLVGKIGPGPLHSIFQSTAIDPCKELWWSNILLINNFYPVAGTNGNDWYSPYACMSWTWYLAVDWQLFLTAPFFVLVFWKHRIVGWAVIGTTLLGAVVVQVWLATKYNYSMNPLHEFSGGAADQGDEYHRVASIKPYTRCVPYLMGLGAAMIFHHAGGRKLRGRRQRGARQRGLVHGGGARGGGGGGGGSASGSATAEDSAGGGVGGGDGGGEVQSAGSMNASMGHVVRTHSVRSTLSDDSGNHSSSPRRTRNTTRSVSAGGRGSARRSGLRLDESRGVLFGFVLAFCTILTVVFLPASDYLGAGRHLIPHVNHNKDGHHHGYPRSAFDAVRRSSIYGGSDGGSHTRNVSSSSSSAQTLPSVSNWSDLSSVLYAVLSHVAMGIAMSYIVLAFSLGHGGWLRSFCSATFWQPLSRLTFGVYLVHPIVIFFSYTSALDLVYFQTQTVFSTFVSMTILSFLLSFVLFLLITLPSRRIGRAIIWGLPRTVWDMPTAVGKSEKSGGTIRLPATTGLGGKASKVDRVLAQSVPGTV